MLAKLLAVFLVSAPVAWGEPALVLGAPPAASGAEAHRLYDPLARYLGVALGRPVVFRAARAWWIYQDRIQRSRYDIVFAGPSLTGWQVVQQGHQVLAAASQPMTVEVVVPAASPIEQLAQLRGHTLCARPAPSLPGVVAQTFWSDPLSAPNLLDVGGPGAAVAALAARRCAAAVVVQRTPLSRGLRVLGRRQFPGMAFSVAPGLAGTLGVRLQEALLAPAAGAALRPLVQSFDMGSVVRAAEGPYRRYAGLLQATWGFSAAARAHSGIGGS